MMVDQNKKTIMAMVFSRDTWIGHMRNRLVGPLREYAKDKMAPFAGIDYSWHDEIEILMRKVKDLFDPQKTKTKTKFDLNGAFAEAFMEAAGEQYKVREAIEIFMTKYMSNRSNADKTKFQRDVKLFDSEELLLEMLEEYAPELLERLQLGME